MSRAFVAILFAASAYVGVILVGSQLDLPRTTADTSLKPRTELLAAAGETSFLGFIGQVASDGARWAYCSLVDCEDKASAELPESPARLPSPPVETREPTAPLPVARDPLPTPRSQPAQASAPPVVQNITQPVIERVVERDVSGVDEPTLLSRINDLRVELLTRISQAASPAGSYSGPPPTTSVTTETFAAAQKIDQLTGTTITNPTITGGSITAASISGTISAAIDTAAATINALTATTLSASNASTTNATTTNATTTNLYVSGTATLGSGTGILQSTSGVVSAIANGANGQVLKMVGGVPAWSTDLSGGGGGASAWATTTDDLAIYPADTTDVLILGASATTTTGNILEVSGNTLLRGALTAYNTATAPTFTATSTTATSTFPRLNIASSLALGTDYVTDITGTGLTLASGALTLDTSGTWSGNLGGYTAAQLLANSFATTSADYWENQQTARTADDLTNNSIEDLSDVGAITENYGDLLYWNGSSWSDIATSSLGLTMSSDLANYLALSAWYATTTDGLDEGSTNRYYTDARVQTYVDTISKGFFFSTTSADSWKADRNFFATTSADYWKSANDFFSTTSAQYFAHSSTTIPKTYTANSFTALQTFGNASTTNFSATYASSTQGVFGSLSLGTLSGFLKATAGAIATAAIDLASDVTGILGVNRGGTGWSAVQTGSVLYGNGSSALATTSAGTNGQVLALLAGVPTWTATTTFSSGLSYSNGNVTLDASGSWGGTFDGQEGSYYLNAANLTNFGTPFYTFFSATTTDALPQGATNRYYADSLVQAFVHGSTTIPKTYSTNTFTGTNTFSSLTLGSLNGPLHANAGVITATTSIGILYGGTGLTSAPSYGQLLVGNASGGYALTATSSLGLPTFGYLFPSNATTTTLIFSNGLLSLASTTIGSGSQSGGLTISGGATTTGNLIVQSAGTSTFAAGLQATRIDATSASSTVNGLRITGNGLQVSSLISCGEALETDGNGNIVCGTDATGAGGSYPFPLAGNATSTLTQFNGGITAFASSTIGAGTQAGGLTIFGGATTTGNAYFAGNVGIGTTSPASLFSINAVANFQTGTSTIYENLNVRGQLKVGTESIFLNGSATSSFSSGIQTAALNVTSGTSTFANGLSLSGGCFSVNGTCLTSGSGGGQLLATYATSSVGTTTVNFNGAAGSQPSFSGATLTLPSNTSYIVVEVWGGGGGGAGGGGGDGSAGGTSCFGTNSIACASPTLSATGGNGGVFSLYGGGGVGGTGSGGDTNLQGNGGVTTSSAAGGSGGKAPRGGSGGIGGAVVLPTAGSAFGGGGGGGNYNAGVGGGGGGGGGYSYRFINAPTGTYYYTVASGGAAGSGGSGNAGAAGGTGGLVISVYTTGISNGSLGSGITGQIPYYSAAGTNLSATSSLFINTNSRIGVGTTTPSSLLNIAGAAAKLTLTDTSAGANLKHWFTQSTGGLFKIGTTSDALIETNSVPFSISSTGFGTTTLSGLTISGSATSTSNVGFNLSGGCFAVNGTCVGGQSISGTTGQFAYFSNTNTQTATSTLFLQTNSNLGIGTTTPNSKLTVYGDAFLEGSSRYLNFGTTTGSGGYGFRDNAGVLEFKNSGGAWQGVTTATTGPSFRVHKNGTNQTVTASTITLLTWSTETFDTNNNFDLSTERFTPTVPGKYLIQVEVSCIGNNGYCASYIYKNGSVYAEDDRYATSDIHSGVAAIVDMNGTTDYVEAYVYNHNGTTISGVIERTYFTGALIAPVNTTAGGWQNDGTQSFLGDSTDKVGVGTTSPWAKLSINSTAGIPQFVIGSSTTQLIVDASGNVGMGTTSPFTGSGGVKLQVYEGEDSEWSGRGVFSGATNAAIIGSYAGVAAIGAHNAGLSAWTDLAINFGGGNVGIGTTTPTVGRLTIASTTGSQLSLSAGGGIAQWAFRNAGGNLYLATTTVAGTATTSTSALTIIGSTGNVGIGTSSPAELLSIDNGSNGAAKISLDAGSSSSQETSILMYDRGTLAWRAGRVPDGRYSIYSAGTSGEVFSISTNGNIQFGAYGAGTLTTDGSGNITASSDERLKDILGSFDRGLADLELINPIFYEWKPETGFDASTTYAGFSAQNVQQAIPEAVGEGKDGFLTLQDRPLIAAAINAIKEIASITGAFKANLIAWLADAQNGIERVVARVFKGQRAEVNELCVGSTCITEAQFAAVFGANANDNPPASGPAHGNTSENLPPATTSAANVEIIVAGNNPATLNIGDAYADLGAVASSSDQSLIDLGIRTFYGGEEVTTVSIDTTQAGEHTIPYRVISAAGEILAEATRTVIVSAPQVGNDNEPLSDDPSRIGADREATDESQPSATAAGN